MPANSRAQQRLFGMVHAYQKGELKDPSKEVKGIAKEISKKDADKFASTKWKGLPNRVKSKKTTEGKEVIKINEAQLNKIIEESVKKVLEEDFDSLGQYHGSMAFPHDREFAKSVFSLMKMIDEKLEEEVDEEDYNDIQAQKYLQRAYDALHDLVYLENNDY